MTNIHRRLNSRTKSRGFTLIELLVVIIILAILAAVVLPRVIGRADDARQAKAISDIKSIETALDNYKLDTGSYPSTEQGIGALISNVGNVPKWNGPYVKNGQLSNDPWGKQYQYKCPPEHGTDYDIFTFSPDGQSINNWDIK